jgi:hypothetical protein
VTASTSIWKRPVTSTGPETCAFINNHPTVTA